MDRIVLGIYSLLMWLAQPFMRLKLLRRGQAEPVYLDAVAERFGRYRGTALPGAVWIHAVSLGETRAAAILIGALRKREPGLRLLLTHGTATGRAEGESLLHGADAQAWLPWDTPGAVRRFLDHFAPALGVLMETEVWPNLAASCHARGIPLVLANARLSDKSLQQSLRLAALAQPAYQSLRAAWAQSADDARRLHKLGAPASGVFGNLKFDAQPDAVQLEQGRAWRKAAGRAVVLFASSREEEEAEFLRILEEKMAVQRSSAGSVAMNSGAERALDAAAEVQWLIVPRHPQRFDEVAALIARHGFQACRRSGWDEKPPAEAASGIWAPILLGDSLGEMALYYGLADVALLGGSFAPLGGQNLIEAAACGCPIVMGPHTFNFAEAAELSVEAGAACRADALAAAIDTALELCADARGRENMARSASRFARAHQGAARKTADAVLTILHERDAEAPQPARPAATGRR